MAFRNHAEKCCSPQSLRRHPERIASVTVLFSMISFFSTFLTFDFFATLLGFVTMILVLTSTCRTPLRRQNPVTTTHITSCMLSFMTSGVLWWSMLVMLITTVCDTPRSSTTTNTTNSTVVQNLNLSVWMPGNNTSMNLTTIGNGTIQDDMFDNEWNRSQSQPPTSTIPPSGNEGSEYSLFFCSHREWIMTFTMLSAVGWSLTGCLMLVQILQAPAPLPRQRPRRPVVMGNDDATVLSVDDDDDDVYDDENVQNQTIQHTSELEQVPRETSATTTTTTTTPHTTGTTTAVVHSITSTTSTNQNDMMDRHSSTCSVEQQQTATFDGLGTGEQLPTTQHPPQHPRDSNEP